MSVTLSKLVPTAILLSLMFAVITDYAFAFSGDPRSAQLWSYLVSENGKGYRGAIIVSFVWWVATSFFVLRCQVGFLPKRLLRSTHSLWPVVQVIRSSLLVIAVVLLGIVYPAIEFDYALARVSPVDAVGDSLRAFSNYFIAGWIGVLALAAWSLLAFLLRTRTTAETLPNPALR